MIDGWHLKAHRAVENLLKNKGTFADVPGPLKEA